MKRAILTLIVASLALVGCKRDNPTEPIPVPEDVIPLSSGMDASVMQYGMMTKSGVRDQTGFKVGDHIGITAIYSTNNKSGVTEDKPDLAVARWFLDEPATAEVAQEVTPSTEPKTYYNPFHWGVGATSIPSDGGATPGDYQFYPQGRNIFLFAYYPLAKGLTGEGANGVEFTEGKVAADATASLDKIKVTLQAETLNTGVPAEVDKNLTLKQPDVMVGANSKNTAGVLNSVNRKSPIEDVQLSFKHVLAQLRLRIRRTDEVKEVPVLQKVEISWPKVATYDVKEAATAPQDLPAQTTDADGKKTYAEADLVKHTITCSIEIPTGTADDAFDILGKANKEVIMLHPLTKAQLEGCVINITVKFPSIENPKVFPISLTSLNDGIVQGSCNIVNFLVNYVKIDITGDIEPWAVNDNVGNSEID